MFQHLRLFAMMSDPGYPPSGVKAFQIVIVKRKGESRQKAGNIGLGFQPCLKCELPQQLNIGVAFGLGISLMDVGIRLDFGIHSRGRGSL